MKATDFERSHQLLLHELIVGAAVLIYLFDRDDVIWRFVKTSPTDARILERVLFVVATLLFGVSAWIGTHARARRSPIQIRCLGEFLYALALASLVPLAGSLILIAGEAIRILRLLGRGIDPVVQENGSSSPRSAWAAAFRREILKWGLFLTMVAFTVTLRDRLAEILISAGVILWALWALLNIRLSSMRTSLQLCFADRRA
jgi:hypothetical protein